MSKIYNGVMLNAYPDSVGSHLGDIVKMLQLESFRDVFSMFYILPTFFNSDLDRGFSIIDYGINRDLVSEDNLAILEQKRIALKFDIVLNHLSVASPQFKDLLVNGDESEYKDFFINWNTFWEGHGTYNDEGVIIPDKQYLDKLFMRKSGLPILNVNFPDGSIRPYWNTFYQKIIFNKIDKADVKTSELLEEEATDEFVEKINQLIEKNVLFTLENIGIPQKKINELNALVNKKKTYLGQMDVNAKSDKVWQYYDDVLSTLSGYGCKIVRLDAFAYLHKEIGETNFFNKPGTWEYLSRIKTMAQKYNLLLLPEIHAEDGLHLHDEVAGEGYMIYDFFLPGLIIHTIEKRNAKALYKWGNEIITKKFKTVNMLGCHDGIPVLDLKGKEVQGKYNEGLLSDEEIDDIMQLVIDRGGKVKNLYGADGKKISYYQVNATYYSALGENDKKMLFARAIQMFMPGIPQVWYLDIFGGTNDYEAVEKAGADGHKEINRSNISLEVVKEKMATSLVKEQLHIMYLRNNSSAFEGEVEFLNVGDDKIHIRWVNGTTVAEFEGDLTTLAYMIRT